MREEKNRYETEAGRVVSPPLLVANVSFSFATRCLPSAEFTTRC